MTWKFNIININDATKQEKYNFIRFFKIIWRIQARIWFCCLWLHAQKNYCSPLRLLTFILLYIYKTKYFLKRTHISQTTYNQLPCTTILSCVHQFLEAKSNLVICCMQLKWILIKMKIQTHAVKWLQDTTRTLQFEIQSLNHFKISLHFK
jgi:hypothetical protein